jgi:hypothetical protein
MDWLDSLELDEVQGEGRHRERLSVELEKGPGVPDSLYGDIDVRYRLAQVHQG